MQHVYRTTVALILGSLSIGAGSAAGQDLTASQTSAIRTEAQQHVERYYGYYFERDPQALATEIFVLPWIAVTGDGVRITLTEEENLARFEQAIAGLVERGWNRSIFTTKNVCVLTADAAIVSGTNTRTRGDGSVMSVNGVSYILARTDDGWRTISFVSHPPTRVVRCDDE